MDEPFLILQDSPGFSLDTWSQCSDPAMIKKEPKEETEVEQSIRVATQMSREFLLDLSLNRIEDGFIDWSRPTPTNHRSQYCTTDHLEAIRTSWVETYEQQ